MIENFDIINIEYMENGEETFDYPEEMLVSVETRKDDSIDHTKDSIRAKIKSYIRRNFGNDVEVVDFLAFPVGSDIQLGQLSFEFDAETFEAKEKKIGSIRIVKNPNFPSGTSLQAYIKTNRAELRKVFGNPNMGESGDGKSKGKEWNLIVGNHRVTIYDRREMDKKGTKYFNIGGDGKYGALLVAQALSIHRNERVYAKEITPKWLEDRRQYQQVKSIDEYPDLTYERAKEYEDNRRRYRAETFEAEDDLTFKEWADQEMMTHGGRESFDDWLDDELKSHGDNISLQDWGHHELDSHYERYGAEDYQKKMYQDFLDNWDDEWEGSPPTFEEWKELVKDAEDWGGNPKGKLARALQKARENAKKPKKPLKIEKLDAETFNADVKMDNRAWVSYYDFNFMNVRPENPENITGDSKMVSFRDYRKELYGVYLTTQEAKKAFNLLKGSLLGRGNWKDGHYEQVIYGYKQIYGGSKTIPVEMKFEYVPIRRFGYDTAMHTKTKNAETSGQWEIGEQLEEAQMNAASLCRRKSMKGER